MSDRRLPPNTQPARFWIALPAVILILADTLMTFLFQPTSYWAEGHANRVEQSPLGAAILGGHPALFAGFILIWILIVVLLVARLRHPWNKAMALAVVVGHTAGIYGWLVLRNYWYTIPTFILVGILTVACWQKAEAAR